jgi:hypothetical protein
LAYICLSEIKEVRALFFIVAAERSIVVELLCLRCILLSKILASVLFVSFFSYVVRILSLTNIVQGPSYEIWRSRVDAVYAKDVVTSFLASKALTSHH